MKVAVTVCLCFLLCALGETSAHDEQLVSILPGVKLSVAADGISVKFDATSFFGVGRSKDDEEDEEDKEAEKRPKILQRIGAMMMMVPLVMQLLSLPGAIASIKLSLLRSLIVGKMALIVMLINFLRSQRSSELVVVHEPPPVHYDHYYSPYDDDDDGWIG